MELKTKNGEKSVKLRAPEERMLRDAIGMCSCIVLVLPSSKIAMTASNAQRELTQLITMLTIQEPKE